MDSHINSKGKQQPQVFRRRELTEGKTESKGEKSGLRSEREERGNKGGAAGFLKKKEGSFEED